MLLDQPTSRRSTESGSVSDRAVVSGDLDKERTLWVVKKDSKRKGDLSHPLAIPLQSGFLKMASNNPGRTRTPIPQIVREDAHSGNMLIGFEMFPWTTERRQR
jgi:hypothetical protein